MSVQTIAFIKDRFRVFAMPTQQDFADLIDTLTSVVPNTRTDNYTLVATDVGKAVRMNISTAKTLTVPPDTFVIGAMITVRGVGVGVTTIAAGSGVTLNGSIFTISQNGSAVLHLVSANEWDVYAGGTSLTQLATPTLTATVVSGTQIDLSVVQVTNNSGYKWYKNTSNDFSTATLLATTATGANTQSATGLTASTHYYFWAVALGDNVTYSDSTPGADDDTTSAGGGTWTDLTVASSANTTIASNVYTANSGNPSYDSRVLFNETITGDGRIRMKRDASIAQNCTLAVSVTNSLPADLSAVNFGAFMAISGTLIAVTPPGVSTGITVAVGEYVIIDRTGSTIKIYRSTDGDTLTDLAHTFTATTSATLYIAGVMYGTNGIMYYPQIHS